MSHPIVHTVLVAEGDSDDCNSLRLALAETGFSHELRFVRDGQELLDYLRQRGRFQASGAAPEPRLILLELDMRPVGGRAALVEIKADPGLRAIPVVVFTRSTAAEDVTRCYDAGANAFIRKPTTFAALVDMLKSLERYWFHLADLPEPAEQFRTLLTNRASAATYRA